MWGQDGKSLPSSQFCCEPKTSLKDLEVGDGVPYSIYTSLKETVGFPFHF